MSWPSKPKNVLPARWRPFLIALAIFTLNAYICRELFTIGFIHNLDSNEGVFVSISRFFREHGLSQGWYPWFNAGMPIGNAYQPLLPGLAALAGKLTGWSVERAFHFVLATLYCAGPVALFWFAWDWSESLTLGIVAGFAYSLWSPAELLIPVLRVNTGGHWAPLRLYNLIHYAEDPHNLALTLLPLALLFLRRAILRRSPANLTAAVASCAAVVLSNAFGAVDLAIGGLCIVLAVNRGVRTLLLTGLAAYLLVSPWVPPSLLDLIRRDQWGAVGLVNTGPRTWITVAAALALFAILWFLTLRLRSSFDRFAILFAFWMCLIPLGYFLLGLTMVPQGNRYQLELEMALCLALACLCSRIPGRTVVIAALILLGVRQTAIFRHFARDLISPIDITRTIQYKTIMWLDHNLPGQRAMISGDTEFLYNIFSNSPQLSGGHAPTAPNWMQRVAVYGIYTGTSHATLDAEYSVLWLKAYGSQAITVPGEKSREAYHPVAHPHKFDGILPVLWHDEDDTIFAVPQRSPSLAHVVPTQAIVSRPPIHGLDVDPLRAYVSALDDPRLPLADLIWSDPSHAVIRAPMERGQVLSVQVNYVPGWRAHAQGREIPVTKDALGLMILEPGCVGPCEVTLTFGLSAEAKICRVLSILVVCALAGFAVYVPTLRAAPGTSAIAHKEPLPPPSPR